MQSLNINQTITAWPSIVENVFVPHTEAEYEHLVEILDSLINQVGEDENHTGDIITLSSIEFEFPIELLYEGVGFETET